MEGAPPPPPAPQIHVVSPKQKTSVLQQGVCPAAAGDKPAGDLFFPSLLPLEGTSGLQTMLRGHWQRGQAEGGLWGPQPFGLVSKLAARMEARFASLRLHSRFTPRWCHDVGVAVPSSAAGQQCFAPAAVQAMDVQARQGTSASPASVSHISSLADSDSATGDFPGRGGSLRHPGPVGTLLACMGPALGHPSCSRHGAGVSERGRAR